MKAKDEVKVTLRVLITREEGWMVAQALEHDLAAQGRDLDDVKRALERTVVGQIVLDLKDGKAPLAEVPPAPDRFWRFFESSRCERPAEPRRFIPPKGVPDCFIIDAVANDRRICFGV